MNAFTTDPTIINNRIKSRLSRGEFLGLTVSLSMLVVIFIIASYPNVFPFVDYNIFVNASHGNAIYYYYAYWLLPIFKALDWLPTPAGIIIWDLLNIAGIWFAARVFGGRGGLALISYQMLYTIFVGQIAGIVVGCLALLWWGLANQKWHWAGFGLAIAAAKYQLGGLSGLFLLIMAAPHWQKKWRVFIVPTLVAIGSLIIYPMWIVEEFHRIQTVPPNDWGSITLWRWIGAWGLLLFLPPLLMSLSKEKRFIGLLTASALALPYFQHTDLLLLFTLPIDWFVLLGSAGYGLPIWGWHGVQITVPLILLILYSSIFIPEIYKIRQKIG